MRALDIIRAKRDGLELAPEQIREFARAAADGSWPEYQLSALLMAIYLNGMTAAETALLTEAMTNSGKRYRWDDLPGPKVDKHSTGGVGDKTSLILAPLAAACGVIVPMMSGRGLGHTGGTLDKLESIPGFRIHLTEQELRQALRTVGVGMIGQSLEVAPADRTLYALRDVTGTVESIPLITASILSKKLAEGIDGLVMDVKAGCGAFMKTRERSRELAEMIVRVGSANSVRTEAVITPMDVPLGRAVGNSLEVIESIETLKGNGPRDLEELSVILAARMVRLGGLAKSNEEAEGRVRQALTSGAGLEKFRHMVEQQGGNPRVVEDYSLLPTETRHAAVTADRAGYVTELHAERIGHAAMILGAGRHRADAHINPAVGVLILAHRGERVQQGDAILQVLYHDDASLGHALKILHSAITIADGLPPTEPLILDDLGSE